MCRTSVNAPSMMVESYYNDVNRNSDVILLSNRSIGIFNNSVEIMGSYLLCNFSREKSLPGLEKFFNISNPFYILVASGMTNSSGKFQLHLDV